MGTFRSRQKLLRVAGAVVFLGFLELSLGSLYGFILPPIWRWSNPGAHGANIFDMTFASGTYIEVGERGQVFVSEDGATWYPRDTGATNSLRAVAFFGGRLVITGEDGAIFLTENLTDYYTASQSTADWLVGVSASSNLVVAVGDNAAIYTSPNAVSWTRRTVPFTNWLTGVAYGTNTFVAVGERGFIATSVNGIAWTPRTSGTTTNLNRVAWTGDRFLAVGEGGNVWSSWNGGDWTPVTTGASATNSLYSSAGFRTSRLVAGSYEVRLQESANFTNELSATLPSPAPTWVYYASLTDNTNYSVAGRTGLTAYRYETNGRTYWYSDTNSIRSWLWSVTHTPSNYLAVGNLGTILSSPNGIDWDLELTPASATNSVLLGVGGSTNLFLIAGSRGTVLWATNIFFWNAISPSPTTNDLQGVCYDGTRYTLCGGNGTILTSTTGTNWISRTSPTNVFLMSVEPYPDGLVAVGDWGTVLTSANSTNWFRQTTGTTNWLSQVRYLNRQLIAVGENGTILTSVNGTNWTAHASGTTSWLNAVDYVNGAWFIAGNQGTMLISTNATNWVNTGTITKNSLYGLVINNGQLVTVGTEGAIVRSQVIPPSTPVNFNRYARNSGQNVFLFTGQPDQRFYLTTVTNLVSDGTGSAAWTTNAFLEFFDSTGTLLFVDDASTNNSRDFYRTSSPY